LTDSLKRLSQEILPYVLFPKMPIIRFAPEQNECSCHVYDSKTLLQLVASRCNVAYDVLVFVGKALFQRYRTAEEVRIELVDRGVRLSASEIDYLGHKFICYLAHGHRLAMPRII
jgi:hypothetical protein